MPRNYRLIFAPRKFDVLKTNVCDFKKIKFPRGNYLTDSSETDTLLSLLFPEKIQPFYMHEARGSQM